MIQKEELLGIALEAAIRAGKETLSYYKKEIQIDVKDDNSPLTQADLAANKIIETYLLPTDIPILSEEKKPEKYSERKNWERLWIVDPLDGTKEFIKHSDEYTVNIALVEDKKPMMGVVYAPAMDLLYYGVVGHGSYKVSNAALKDVKDLVEDRNRINLPSLNRRDRTVVVASKSHLNEKTQEFLNNLSDRIKDFEINSFGSSLKLCMVAEGAAHIYPRLGPTMEWDTAASHAIVLASGNLLYKYPSFGEMVYNKEDLLNPEFIVYSPEKEKAVKS